MAGSGLVFLLIYQHETDEDQNKTSCSTDGCGKACSKNVHFGTPEFAKDHNPVQQHVQQTDKNIDNCHNCCFSASGEKGVERLCQTGKESTGKKSLEIIPSMREKFRGHSVFQNKISKRQEQNKTDGCHQGESESGPGCANTVFIVFLSVILCNQCTGKICSHQKKTEQCEIKDSAGERRLQFLGGIVPQKFPVCKLHNDIAGRHENQRIGNFK